MRDSMAVNSSSVDEGSDGGGGDNEWVLLVFMSMAMVFGERVAQGIDEKMWRLLDAGVRE